MQPVSGEGSVWDRAYKPRDSPRRGKENSRTEWLHAPMNPRESGRPIDPYEVQLCWDAELDINDKLFRFGSHAIGRVYYPCFSSYIICAPWGGFAGR